MLTDSEELESFNSDWTKKFAGKSQLVVKPGSTEEISAILKHCNERKLAIVPQGGNTSLVGGSVPVHDEIILRTDRLNKILGFDETYGILSAQAGCILSDLQEYALERDHEVPLDLGAKGSCQIGGNLATNAGGIKFLRHNSLHATCVGLKMVLADGTILDNMSSLRKDNTGYDLKHLFIGAEGTLGLITECALLCPPVPKNRHLALLSCRSFRDVLTILKLAKGMLGDVIQAFEVMDNESMELVQTLGPAYKSPFPAKYPFYVLIETGSAGAPLVKS